MFEENREFWERFIYFYRDRTCLWDTRCKEYGNKNWRNDAYGDLVQLCTQINPSADKTYVVKKINSLRASFRRQLRKIKEGDTTEPTLWYYELMLFTIDQDEARSSMPLSFVKTERNVEDQSEAETGNESVVGRHLLVGDAAHTMAPLAEDDEQDEKMILDEGSDSSVHSSVKATITPQSSPKISRRPRTSMKRRGGKFITWDLKRNKLADSITNFLKDGGNVPDNDCSAFGKSVGLELELIRDIGQRNIAKKLIADVLFQAKRGKLLDDARIQVSWVNL